MNSRGFSVRAWSTAFALWTTLAALSVLQTALYLEQRGQTIAWRSLVGWRLLDWYTCFAFAPAYVWLIRRNPFDAGTRLRSVSLTVAATSVFVFIKYAALHSLTAWVQPAARVVTLGSLLATNFFTEMLFLGGIALAIYALELNQRLQQGLLERSELARDLAEARLDALSLQLQPHFLFNTMNGAAALIRRDPDAADDMLTDLGELLQDTLRDEGHEVPLARELDYLGSYLRIMQRRFGAALVVRMEVEPGVRQALVPKFLLQPVVENSIEHGLALGNGTVCVVISAYAHGERLRITVSDNGQGFPDTEKPVPGIGLGNTRRRLQQLYGAEHRLELESKRDADGTTTVTIELPCRSTAAIA
jgi:two-component system, LytTR family, sensor kinase